MKILFLRLTTSIFFLVFFISTTYSQEVKKDGYDSYRKLMEADEYKIIKQGLYDKGELPQSFSMDFEQGQEYVICIIPKGKLKNIEVHIGFYQYVFSNDNSHPVIYESFKSFQDKTYEVQLFATNQRRTKRKRTFKLSSDDSVYYIIGKKLFLY